LLNILSTPTYPSLSGLMFKNDMVVTVLVSLIKKADL